MTANPPDRAAASGRWGWVRRWAVFGSGVGASVLPALAVALTARPPAPFLHAWGRVLLGPLLRGSSDRPDPAAADPMGGPSGWVYAACLAVALAHPVWRRPAAGWASAVAFSVWYGWALGRLAGWPP